MGGVEVVVVEVLVVEMLVVDGVEVVADGVEVVAAILVEQLDGEEELVMVAKASASFVMIPMLGLVPSRSEMKVRFLYGHNESAIFYFVTSDRTETEIQLNVKLF